jgi:hypothetical protein
VGRVLFEQCAHGRVEREAVATVAREVVAARSRRDHAPGAMHRPAGLSCRIAAKSFMRSASHAVEPRCRVSMRMKKCPRFCGSSGASTQDFTCVR